MVEKITARHLEISLEKKYLHYQQGWALLREVSVADPIVRQAQREYQAISRMQRGTPEAIALFDIAFGSAYLRRIDVLLMRISTIASAKVSYERIAIEIKVSRGDFFRDTAEKRRVWQTLAHRFAYLTPVGLIKPEEVPEGCGLLELGHIDGVPDWKVRAPRREGDPDAFTDKFVAYLAGRASSAEYALRRQRK